MAKLWKPEKYKEPKQEIQPHVMTLHEKQLIEQLTPVIKGRHLMKFWYEDTDRSDFEDWRIVEPHLIGQHKYKAANIMLVAWFLPTIEQMGDGHFEDWKQYNLDTIKRIEILPNKYTHTRPFYNPFDKRMKAIFCAT
jgi:hypothetical protein